MDDVMLGEIRSFSFPFAPPGWVACNGQLLGIAVNQALYSLLGTIYGGDGQTTFGVPNLRGRVLVGRGKLPGGGDYVQGGYYGYEEVALSVEQIPSHRHSWAAANAPATVAPALNNLLAQPVFGEQPVALYAPPGEGDAFVRLSPDSVASIGAGRTHGNVQPYLAVGYCIALHGYFPQRG